MTSNDNFVTIEVFSQRMDIIEKKFDKLENLIATEIRVNEVSHQYLQTSIYWGFAIMGVVIGLVGLVVAIIALKPFRKEKPESKPEWTERDLRALIREEISMANSVTNISRRT